MKNNNYFIVKNVFSFINKRSNFCCAQDISDKLKNHDFILDLEDFRNTQKWVTYENKKILIKDISDNHLINIIGHLSITGSDLYTSFMMIHEFFNRGLISNDLLRFQIPHVNKDGKTVLMNYDGLNKYQTYEVT